MAAIGYPSWWFGSIVHFDGESFFSRSCISYGRSNYRLLLMMEPLFYQFATIFIRLIRVGFGCSLEVSGYWLLVTGFWIRLWFCLLIRRHQRQPPLKDSVARPLNKILLPNMNMTFSELAVTCRVHVRVHVRVRVRVPLAIVYEKSIINNLLNVNVFLDMKLRVALWHH